MDTLDQILVLIKGKGWSNSYFAKMIGKNVSIVTDWKTGRSESYLRILPQIAELLGTTEAYLRGETDDPSATQPPPKEGWDDIEVLAASSDIPLNELTPEQQQEVKDFVNYLLSKQKKQ